jgi:glyoxylase-like metal-dependent hydrolase (beta-lactamase superfamily II)
MTTILRETQRFSAIGAFDPPSLDTTPAEQLRRIRERAPAFRDWFRETGRVTGFAARSLVTLPYPRRYALWEACRSPVPYVWMTNRMFVVRWEEEGRTRTLVAEPSDYELGLGTPYLQKTVLGLPLSYQRAIATFFIRHGTIREQLAALGVAPEDVDYVTFDHLHTQDIRRIVGTKGPQPEIGFPDGPVPPLFPNAKFIVQPAEIEHVRDVHPFQARFHQSWTYDDIRDDDFLFIEGDVLVAPGLALLRTAGHTFGNQTIVLNTDRGIFTSSENGIAVEAYAPEHSRLPGVRAWAERWGLEVVLNFNTPEFASWQYNSMIKEKLIADPIPERPELPQVYPSSELTRHPLAPGIRPAYRHGELTIGEMS